MSNVPDHLRLPGNMRGAKWFNAVTYVSDADRAKVVAAIARAKSSLSTADARTVGVRPPSFIGEPHPFCAITYGPGGSRLYGVVHSDRKGGE